MRIVTKQTIWESFHVPTHEEESLSTFLKEHPQADAEDLLWWADERGLDLNPELVPDTAEFLHPSENGGFATVEVELDNGTVFWKNGE